jgi:hypothetical protein
VAIAFAVACQALIDHLIRPTQLETAQHTVGDLVIQPVSGLYGVLVAFLLAGALTGYQELRRGITNETTALIDLGRIAESLPPPTGYEIRAATLEYTRSVIVDEWPRLAQGGSSSQTSAALANLWHPVQAFSPQSAGDANLHALALDLVRTIALQRRLRILAASRTIPALVWVILAFGGAITVVLSTFSAPPRQPLRHAFVASLAIIIALALYSLYVLSHPFGSAVPLISPERLLNVQELLTKQP